MFSNFKLLFITILIAFITLNHASSMAADKSAKNSIYDFKLKDIDGKTVDFSKYKGKVLLIVNVASKCGFTRQYSGLQELYLRYKSKGFEILAFPCNQFGGQEPGTNEEIKSFCTNKYDVSFPLFDKIDVNGDNQSPLYKFLKANQDVKDDVKWNFTKFLISKDGKTIKRYEPQTTPEDLDETVNKFVFSN